MLNGPTILICDDEPDLRAMLGEYLTGRGFAPILTEDGTSLRAAMQGAKPALILLDVAMPGEDGLSLLRWLRREDSVPVIMLTAAGAVIDRVVGLEMGADDYLAKPVDLRELEARIRAVLRRPPPPPPPRNMPAGSVPFGPCHLDLDGARLFDPEGDEIPITPMEFSLLRMFARNRGRVLNRDQILDDAHDRTWEPFDRSVDLRISRLRRKIEPNPKKPQVIRTVRGIGYAFE
ncbi:response regulator transcription factor [Jannaschia sp. LMIT008]|uniref:response regulator transcription factor n=1 Tax=Jannaschia maritima TaxID=3032585 RepID=UPI002812422F|nr:response regulator transcription factor [Jannaschia sp. LMIT008]